MSEFRPMYMSDLPRVVKIIDSHDDDDAEAAEEDYQTNGFDDQYVLEVEGKVVGLTGFRRVPATDNTVWLSWTYVHANQCGKGYGKALMNHVLDKLRELDARKVFIKVSTYEDPDDGKIYERAQKMYESFGFQLELTNTDFYDQGEDQLIYGLVLRQAGTEDEPEVLEEKPVIRFNGMYAIAECEGGYTFSWTVQEKKPLFGKRSFSVEDLQIGLNAVKNDGGRKVFLTFPSNLPLIHQPLQTAGFKYVGNLTDYYERGVHEMHFSHNLGNL